MDTATRNRFVDMRIADVLKAPAQPDCYIVVLEERGGERQLLIWIGAAEATSMALRLAGMGLPARPLGADLTAALVEALGGRLAEVRVDRLDAGTFYATVALEGPKGRPRWTPGRATPSTSPWCWGCRSGSTVRSSTGRPPSPTGWRGPSRPCRRRAGKGRPGRGRSSGSCSPADRRPPQVRAATSWPTRSTTICPSRTARTPASDSRAVSSRAASGSWASDVQ
jgi:bifunctional DNase/RNase